MYTSVVVASYSPSLVQFEYVCSNSIYDEEFIAMIRKSKVFVIVIQFPYFFLTGHFDMESIISKQVLNICHVV
jgi:hypothetical protein